MLQHRFEILSSDPLHDRHVVLEKQGLASAETFIVTEIVNGERLRPQVFGDLQKALNAYNEIVTNYLIVSRQVLS